MNKIKYNLVLFLAILLFSCDSESAWDCIQTPGTGIVYEASLTDFHSITLQGHMDLVIVQDTLTRIQVETRKNLVDNIIFTEKDGMLFIEEKASCDILNDRSYTTVYVYAPKLNSIRNASTGKVSNLGVWRQEHMGLISENHIEPSYYNNGVFDMNLQVNELNILANGNSFFKLNGAAESAKISFYSGNARLDARTMEIQEIEVYHRGHNHMLVYPVQAIRGEILNTGDVRAYNLPPIVEVEEKYRGRLIFVE